MIQRFKDIQIKKKLKQHGVRLCNYGKLSRSSYLLLYTDKALCPSLPLAVNRLVPLSLVMTITAYTPAPVASGNAY